LNKIENKVIPSLFVVLLTAWIVVGSISSVSACDTSHTFGILAVSQNKATPDQASEGRLVSAVLSLVNPTEDKGGNIIIVSPPYVGTSTQKSINNARSAVANLGSMNLCDIKFRILDKRTSEVDGPSAGLMFSVVLYGLENGKHIPSNIYATGEIDEKGDVLPVGGLYEKALNLCRNHPSSRILTSKIPWLEYHIIAARMKPTCPIKTFGSIKWMLIGEICDTLKK